MKNIPYNKKIVIGVLAVFAGLSLLLSNYYNEKKFEVFDEMNELYYNELVHLDEDVEELESDVIIDEPVVEVTTTKRGNVVDISQTEPRTTKKRAVDYNKYYVGYVSIPKINLRKGFTEINNRYNTVSRNVQVIKPSTYPDANKGNFILAAHSGTSSVSFFKDLYKLKLNDEVIITYKDKEYKYIIKNIYTDTKDGNVTIKRNKDKTTLTLITCTKNDNKTQTIYIAERI